MSSSNDRQWIWMGRGLLVALLIVVGCTVADYGSSWDEDVRRNAGDRKLSYYEALFNGDFEGAAEIGRRPDNYPGFYDLNLAIIRRVSPFSDVLTGHAFSAFFGILGIAGAMRFGRALGGPQVGFWCGFVLVFIPSYYGHLFINPKDIPFACGYIWGVSLAYDWLREDFETTWTTVLSFGLVLGVTIATRIGGLILLCYLGLFVLARWVSNSHTGSGGWGARFLALAKVQGIRVGVSSAIGFAIMLIYWPAAQFSPFGQAGSTLEKVTNYSWSLSVFFEGAFFKANELPFYFIIKMFLLTTPVIVLGMLIMGLFGIGQKQINDFRGKQWEFDRWSGLNLAVFAALFPIAYVILRDSTLYNGVRHLLFVVPVFACIAGWGIAWIRDSIRKVKPSWENLFAGVLVVMLMLVGVNMVRLHPYQYIYYNEFAGGLVGASNRYETDYWGTAYKELAEEFVEYASNQPVRKDGKPFALNMEHPTWLLRPHLPSDGNLRPEVFRSQPAIDDFYLASTQWAADRYYYGVPVARVERMGVTLGVVKDRRGLSEKERELGFEWKTEALIGN